MNNVLPLDEFERRSVAKALRASGKSAQIISIQKKRPDYDIEKMSTELGVPVVETDMPSDLGGFLYPDYASDSGWTIYVRRGLDAETRRWVIAHELSHFILDKGCKPPSIGDEDDIHPCFLHRGRECRRAKYEKLCVGLNGDGDVVVYENAFRDRLSLLASERCADWLAGFILIPAWRVVEVSGSRLSDKEISKFFAVPTGVWLKQKAAVKVLLRSFDNKSRYISVNRKALSAVA